MLGKSYVPPTEKEWKAKLEEIQALKWRIDELLNSNNRFEREASNGRKSIDALNRLLDDERKRAAELPRKIRELLGDYPDNQRNREWMMSPYPPRGW